MSSSFYRGLSPDFLDALEHLLKEPAGQWWRDVLARRDLVVAVRNEYLNVYYRGASLFRVERRGDALVPVTHAKYLSRRQQGPVSLHPDGRFGVSPESALWLTYEGSATLSDMVAAAANLAGPEKIGLHGLLLASPHVVDVEVSFEPAAAEPAGRESDEVEDGAKAAAVADLPGAQPATGGREQRQDRLDVATLEEGDGRVWVVFHEAKHFSNPELRANPGRTPPIVEQIARYRRTVGHHADAIRTAYRDICAALARIEVMRQTVDGRSGSSTLDPLITRVAKERLLPEVDPEPRVVVFGFDRDQRDGALAHLTERLTRDHGLPLYAVGNPSARVTAAFRSRPILGG